MANVAKRSTRDRKSVSIPGRFKPRFWEDSDGRCSVVKAILQRYELLKSHTASESIQRDMLCQRAAFISIILETQEVKAAEGGDLDLGVYTQGTNALSGLLKSLGLEKRLKDISDLKSYLEEKKK